MNKKLLLGVGTVVMALTIGLAACGEGGTTTTNVPAAIKPRSGGFNNVSVHDPSIFKDDDGTYYAFGTHFAVASTKDLIKWNQLAGDGNYQYLYGNNDWKTVLSETVEYVQPDGINSTWAPDVIKIGRKYYMYYSLTHAFGSNWSAIGRVEADNVTGPYSNNVVIVKSTQGGGNPNAIDPTVFWDNDGKLWMVYGSDFGGIQLIELNNSGADVGLPKEGAEQIKLWAGGGNNAEGPYIFYNSETKYYYLMCSYGSLSSSYNMRVARSKKVDGPYEDINEDEVEFSSKGGNKLAGNYHFAGDSQNVALGHNSVLKEGGKYFVVCHVRDRVEGAHHVEVRQLFFNEDGWPVLSPNRYAGETIGKVSEAEFAGDYDVVIHTEGITANVQPSEVFTFAANGTVLDASGEEVGSWKLKANHYYITFDIYETTYKGVVAPGWCNYQNKAVFSITATSEYGNALWANPVAK